MEEILNEDQEASEDSQDSQDEDMSDEERTFDDMTRLRVGTGRVIPTKFHPRNTRDTPQSLFPPGISTNASPHIRTDWKTSMGAAVKNRDLWDCLLGEMEKWDSNGMQVKFWRIPRDWNTDTDYHARHAASEDTRGGFQDIKGILV
ncbi:unnamed protein product [Aspergillus oryzae var. brunneus]|nr:unnamed protein product [Aspergillus oryzae var. brunneus]